MRTEKVLQVIYELGVKHAQEVDYAIRQGNKAQELESALKASQSEIQLAQRAISNLQAELIKAKQLEDVAKMAFELIEVINAIDEKGSIKSDRMWELINKIAFLKGATK